MTEMTGRPAAEGFCKTCKLRVLDRIPTSDAGAVYAGLQRDSGGIQNRLGACAFMALYLGVLGLSSLPIWRAERLLFIRRALRWPCHHRRP